MGPLEPEASRAQLESQPTGVRAVVRANLEQLRVSGKESTPKSPSKSKKTSTRAIALSQCQSKNREALKAAFDARDAVNVPQAR